MGIFFVGNLVRKVSTNWWNLFHTAKSGKYHSPEKQPFPSELSLYNPSGLTVPGSGWGRAKSDSLALGPALGQCTHMYAI